MKKVMNVILKLLKFPNTISVQAKLNKAELKIETLEGVIKDELYKTFMEKLQEPTELARIRRENKNLRAKNKTLKALLKGDK